MVVVVVVAQGPSVPARDPTSHHRCSSPHGRAMATAPRAFVVRVPAMHPHGLAVTPEPPYYAVIFSSRHTGESAAEYEAVGELMFQLASEQPGYLGVDTAGGTVGITVSYWRDEASITAWQQHLEHTVAQERGRSEWYSAYTLRVARVERATSFIRPDPS